MARVAVIIPTWNWSTVLPFSIGSVRNQTFTDWELWVVGDGCTDNSGEVVAPFVAADSRVRWVNLERNYGQQAWPNNEGLRRAGTEWVAYLGHDDLWCPRHLEMLLGLVDSGKADVAYGVVASVEPDGAVRRAAPPWVPGAWMPPSGVLHRRQRAMDLGGWGDFRKLTKEPESDLWQRMSQAGERFACSEAVSVIKFPAARRKGVYAERPCHEQHLWSQKLATETDLPETLTRRLVSENTHRRPAWQRQAWAKIPWRLKKVLRRLRGAEAPEHELGQDYRRFVAERRLFKGLPPQPEE